MKEQTKRSCSTCKFCDCCGYGFMCGDKYIYWEPETTEEIWEQQLLSVQQLF